MADDQQLKRLQQGVSSWNLWRFEAQQEQVDLSQADLRGVALIEVDLSGANLTGAHLAGADLRSANLIQADLREANLREANLSRADLSQADLRRASLVKADLSEAVLTGAKLHKADLRAVRLLGAVLNQASLTGACILDWQINRHTQLQDLDCTYLYLKYDPKHERFVGRRPRRSKTQFKPGDLRYLVQKAQDSVDQIFREDLHQEISWVEQMMASINQNGIMACLFLGVIAAGVTAVLTLRLAQESQRLSNPLAHRSEEIQMGFQELTEALRTEQNGTADLISITQQLDQEVTELIDLYTNASAQAMKDIALSCEWRFRRDNGDTIADSMQLLANGLIEGYSNPNERAWRVQAGNIVLLNEEDQATSDFQRARFSPEGDLILVSQLFRNDSLGEFAHELECTQIK